MTLHEDGAEDVLRQDVLNDARGVGDALAQYADGRMRGRWASEYHDALGQPYTGKWLDVPQTWMWLRVHSMIDNGRVGLATVALEAVPARDRDRDVNARVLAALPFPFDAQLDLEQRAGDDDGTVTWCQTVWGATGDGRGGHRQVECPGPRAVPLEVGACLPSRVILHLIRAGGVARWPYGSSTMHVLSGLPDPQTFVVEQRMNLERLIQQAACETSSNANRRASR